jgi:hypothetical protein
MMPFTSEAAGEWSCPLVRKYPRSTPGDRPIGHAAGMYRAPQAGLPAPGVSLLEGDRPVENAGGYGAHVDGPELPAAPARARKGAGPTGDLEGCIDAQTVYRAVLVMRMGKDRPVAEDERVRLVDNVAGPAR